jgi:hypothetical protein
MCVVIEARDAHDMRTSQESWDILAEVYAAHKDLLDFGDDRRRVYAAQLVIAAWKAHQSRYVPQVFAEVSRKLSLFNNVQENEKGRDDRVAEPEQLHAEADIDFDISFQDIDWSFWSRID